MRFLPVFLLMSLVMGCASVPTGPLVSQTLEVRTFADPSKEYTLVVKCRKPDTARSDAMTETVRRAVRYLPKPILETMVPFEISYDDSHFKSGNRLADAHYCNKEDRICLRASGFVDIATIWHECMHCFDTQLEYAGHSPEKRWLEIAGDVYAENEKDKRHSRFFGDDGLLTAYSRTDWWEDRAEFFTNCLLYLNNRSNAIEGHNYLKRDSRYRDKLQELKNAGLFTEKEYRTLQPLFE